MGSGRTRERLEAHYRIERELADRLRAANRDERRGLYSALYDDLFRRVPDHPMLTRKVSEEARAQSVREVLAFLERQIGATGTYLEIGAGDCALALAMAARFHRVIALDVSEGITANIGRPPHFELRITDGIEIPVEPGSVDLAFSNQVLEHLHVDDALDHVRRVHLALQPGGRYVCITPNPLLGPHDISRYFDASATGFHMREYLTGDLGRLFRNAGFSRVQAIVGARGRFATVPVWPVALVERALTALPPGMRRTLAGTAAFRWLLSGRIVATR